MSARFSHSRTSPTVLFMSSVKARDFAVDNPLSKGDAMNIGFGFRFSCILQWHPIRYGFGSTALFKGNRNSKLPLACPGILVGTELMV